MLFLLISTTYTDSEIFNISKVTIAENSPLDEVHNAASPATEFSIQNTPFYIFRTDFNFRKSFDRVRKISPNLSSHKYDRRCKVLKWIRGKMLK